MIDLFMELWDEGYIILIFIYDLVFIFIFCDYIILFNCIILVQGKIEEIFIKENLELIFGGLLMLSLNQMFELIEVDV